MAQHPSGLTDKRNVIVLQPIGPFGKDEAAILEKLRAYASAFFQLRVRIEKPVPLPDHGKRLRRLGDPAYTQYHTGTLMTDVLLPRLPSDASCYLGITMADLYPDPAWNFVFGQASLRERVGVYSFARYADPDPHVVLRRSCKVLAHETGHRFGIAHCIFYRCIMNGSNHLAESDARPMHLCPIDLKKLQWSVGFDARDRYEKLMDAEGACGFDDEVAWTRRTLTT